MTEAADRCSADTVTTLCTVIKPWDRNPVHLEDNETQKRTNKQKLALGNNNNKCLPKTQLQHRRITGANVCFRPTIYFHDLCCPDSHQTRRPAGSSKAEVEGAAEKTGVGQEVTQSPLLVSRGSPARPFPPRVTPDPLLTSVRPYSDTDTADVG